MTKKIFPFVVLCLFFQFSTYTGRSQSSQYISFSNFYNTAFSDSCLDRFGNKIAVKSLEINDGSSVIASKLSIPASMPASCSSGYFQLYLEPGCGMEGSDTTSLARLNVLCQVLRDLSAFINSPCLTTGQKINIWVKGGLTGSALGEATPYYNIPYSTSKSGIADNCIWLTLNSGKDAFKSVALPLNSWGTGSAGSSYYHGSIRFNFNSGVNWHTNLLTATAAGESDLYTVALHEMMHALGFHSLIAYNGNSVFGAGYSYFSRYDEHLIITTGAPLITNSSSGCSMYNKTFNPGLSPATSFLSPGGTSGCPFGYNAGVSVDHSNCSTAVSYSGGWHASIPVYTPDCFEPGSSLSHFEDECQVPGGFVLGAAGSATNNQYYLMSNSAPTGAYSATTNPGTMKRFPTQEERQTLCDIGYGVDTTFGSIAYLNKSSYSGSVCSGIGIVGMNDGIDSTGTFTFTTSDSTPIYLNAGWTRILTNDYGAGGGSFKCLEVVIGSGTLSATSGSATTTVTYTPTAGAGGIHLLRYIPVNSSGIEGNITYIYVYVRNNCSVSACNLLYNGSFESTLSYAAGPGMFGLGCWQSFAGSPDLYKRGCTNPWWCFPAYSMCRKNSVHPVDTVGNDHYIGIVAGSNVVPGYSSEAISGSFTTGLTNGTTYTIGFWAKLADLPVTASIPSGFNTDPARLQFATSLTYPLTGYSATITGLPAGIDSFCEFTILHPDLDWHYYTTNITYTGASGAQSLIITQAPWVDSTPNNSHYILIDDISIIPYSAACTFNLPDTITYGSIINLDSTVSLLGGYFSWYTDSSGYIVTSRGNIFNSISAYSAAFSSGNDGFVTICYKYTSPLGCQNEVCKNVYIKGGPLSSLASEYIICNISISPNPSAGEIVVAGNLKGFTGESEITFRLYDIIGRLIINETEKISSAIIQKKLFLNQLNDGIYTLTISSKFASKKYMLSIKR